MGEILSTVSMILTCLRRTMAAAGALTLAACSSSHIPGPGETPYPAPLPPASVRRYAALVREPREAFEATARQYRNGCATGLNEALCRSIGLQLAGRAQALVRALTDATDRNAPTYVGPPPAELVELVDETLDAARLLAGSIAVNGAASPDTPMALSRVEADLILWGGAAR
jgi:hypothetical protein